MKRKLTYLIVFALILCLAVSCGETPQEELLPSNAADIAVGAWESDKGDIRIRENLTYSVNGENGTGDKVLFWGLGQAEDRIDFYRKDGSVAFSLFARGDTLLSEDGTKYTRKTVAYDGEYYCRLDKNCLDGDKLYLTESERLWVSDVFAETVEVGGVMHLDFHGKNDIEIETVEDTPYGKWLNDVLTLSYDEEAEAWELIGIGEAVKESVGFVTVTENTHLADRMCYADHETIADCIADSEYLNAKVVVKDGEAVKIVIESKF